MTAEPIFIEGALLDGEIDPRTIIKDVKRKFEEVAPLVTEGQILWGHSAGGIVAKLVALHVDVRVHLKTSASPTYDGSLASTYWAPAAKYFGIADLTGMDQPLPNDSTAEAYILDDFLVSGNPLEIPGMVVRHYGCMGRAPLRLLRGQTYEAIDPRKYPDKWRFSGIITRDGTRIMRPVDSHRLIPAHKILFATGRGMLSQSLGQVMAQLTAGSLG